MKGWRGFGPKLALPFRRFPLLTRADVRGRAVSHRRKICIWIASCWKTKEELPGKDRHESGSNSVGTVSFLASSQNGRFYIILSGLPVRQGGHATILLVSSAQRRKKTCPGVFPYIFMIAKQAIAGNQIHNRGVL
jgi:hypothetical protein